MPEPKPWWSSATIYQIYVRSWRDSNGDGAGDLRGVIEGVAHLEWLGVDCIWLSPTMPSSNRDWGYDVSDYESVHPDFGTLADLDELVATARDHGIAIMLDLVPNHTSDAHPWFLDARSSRDAAHRNYYVWSDPKPDGGPPNNWTDATHGPAWTMDGGGQLYLHNFLKTQPDLNWWEPRVHQEFEDIIRFWFDRGIAGFRVDVAHGLYKDALLRDDPPPRPDDHPAIRERGQRPEYSSHRPEVHDVYRRWRQISDTYEPGRALLGETWEFDPVRFGDYYGREQPELHMGFNFTFVMASLTARQMAEVVETTLSALPAGATPVWTGSNHDVGRFPSRWCGEDPRAVRAALVLLAALPGTVVLYYGDELGMADVVVPEDRKLDEMTMGQPGNLGRDRCRTPMPWTGAPNGGFCPPEARPWLPLGDHQEVNVEAQKKDAGSVLNFVRELNQLRRHGTIGGVRPLRTRHLDDQVWAFTTGANAVVVNLSPAPASCPLPEPGTEVVVSTANGLGGRRLGATVQLGPWEAVVARLPRP